MYKYNKKGFLKGVPARDLTDEEAKQYGEKVLLTSGLYEKKRERKEKQDKTPDKNQQAEE